MNELVIPGVDEEDIGTLLNVRSYSQYTEMLKRILSGVCPFCELDNKLNRVIMTVGDWRVWKNPFPLKHTSNHLVIAPRRHITHVKKMWSVDWRAYVNIIQCVTKDLPGGAVITRFGSPNLNAGSVRHLHTNIVVPDGTGRVQITLAKEPEEIEEKMRILTVFEKLRTSTTVNNLSPEEIALVKGRL